MAGRDHDATVEVVYAGNIGHRRSCGNAEQISVCAGGSQASHKAILEHIARASSVFADDDAGRVRIAIALTQHVVVPAKESLLRIFCKEGLSVIE